MIGMSEYIVGLQVTSGKGKSLYKEFVVILWAGDTDTYSSI